MGGKKEDCMEMEQNAHFSRLVKQVTPKAQLGLPPCRNQEEATIRMKIQVEDTALHLRELPPVGPACPTEPRELEILLRIHFQINDREHFGTGALHFGNLDAGRCTALRMLLSSARSIALQTRADSAFSFWLQLQHGLDTLARQNNLDRSLAAAVASLHERAAIDAVTQRAGTPLWRLLMDTRENPLGIECSRIHPELGRVALREILPPNPYQSLAVRLECRPGTSPTFLAERVQVLSPAQIAFRIGSTPNEHLPWLIECAQAIAPVVHPKTGFVIDLSGGFKTCRDFFHFWADIRSHPALEGIVRRLVALIHPFPDDLALNENVRSFFKGWPPMIPVLVNSAGLGLRMLREAVDNGFHGAVHHPDAGFFKAIADAAFIHHLTERDRSRQWRFLGGSVQPRAPVACAQAALFESILGLDACSLDVRAGASSIQEGNEPTFGLTRDLLSELYVPGSDADLRLNLDRGRIRTARLNEIPSPPAAAFAEAHLGIPTLLKA
jgi:hypothetical protein